VRKRKPSLSDDLLQSIWSVRNAPYDARSLDGLDKVVAAGVAQCLKEAEQSREAIALSMSSVLHEDITLHMLNAYSSESRREHPISVYRFLALIALTKRYDVLDAVIRQIGAKALDGSDVKLLKLGKAYARKLAADDELDAELKSFAS
jgi:RNase adaptor protein for sRNA GlmZ degradation